MSREGDDGDRPGGEHDLLSVAFDRPAPGVLVAHLVGELDLSTAPKLDELVAENLPRGNPRRVVLDLARLGFIDLRGVAVLRRALRRAAAAGADLYLAAAPAKVVRALEFADALTMFDRVPDIADAVRRPAPARIRSTRDLDPPRRERGAVVRGQKDGRCGSGSPRVRRRGVGSRGVRQGLRPVGPEAEEAP